MVRMTEPGGERAEFDLRSYLQVLWARKWIIVVAAVVMVVAAYGVSARQETVYEATAQFRIVPPVNPIVDNQDRGSPASVETEVEVLQSAPVLERVRAALDVAKAPKVVADSVSGTDFVSIQAQAGTAESAAMIANAYVDAYVAYRTEQITSDLVKVRDQAQERFDALAAEVDDLTAQLGEISAVSQPLSYNDLVDRRSVAQSRQLPVSNEIDALNNQLSFVGVAEDNSPAIPPTSPSKPQPTRNALLALPIGLILGIALVFLFEQLDDSVKSKDDLQRTTGPRLPILGLIPVDTSSKRRSTHLVSHERPNSASGEAYRSLRTAVQFLGTDEPLHCLQVTSALAGEGKTTTVANLAFVLARAAERPVVVVDLDLRRPRLHEFFDLDNDIGFTSVLHGVVPVSAAIQTFADEPSVSVLVSGPIPSDPSELLASRRTAEVLASLRADGALVLVDSPPVLPVTDALVISKWVDATLLVTNAGSTNMRQVQRALELLDQVDGPVVGTVLNRAPSGASSYGYGNYAGYSDRERAQGGPPTRLQNGSGRSGRKAPAGT